MRGVILATLALAGCIALSEDDCLDARWSERGLQEGLAGLQPQIDTYVHQCASFGLKPDVQQYMAGWRAGYAEFDRRVTRGRM